MLINKELCIGCTKCIKDCPVNDITMTEDKKAEIKNKRCLECGHCIAVCPVAAPYSETYDMTEVIPYNKEEFEISPERLLNFIKFRRSVRSFTKEPVAPELLSQIIEAGRFTPTGRNLQEVSYIVVTEQLKKVKDMMYAALDKKADAILSAEGEMPEASTMYARIWKAMYRNYQAAPDEKDGLFFHAPAVIFVAGKSRTDAALASSNMELMINALGLGAFYCGFGILAVNDDPNIREFLGLADGITVESCLVIGHPAVTYRRTVPRQKPNIKWF
ncbi:MAG: 4Fe-4S dicluster domain-containing protein [Lachnospiraceae bacterium]|nr:4Fe-4S dicluster domain-containing protein [Lachnospiraceae bacterium]